MRPESDFAPPPAQPFPGRDAAGSRPDQDPQKRPRRKRDLGLTPETPPNDYDDDAWM